MRWKGWCFNAVQNNTSLKHMLLETVSFLCFNAVQNNTSLKLFLIPRELEMCFNAVQNNTSLKRRRLRKYKEQF